MTPKITVSDFDKIRKLYIAAVEGGTLGHVVTTPALEGIRVTDLYVHPAARKLGVASSLIDEVKKRNKGNVLRLRARPYGVKGPDLTRLKDFYRKMGFVDDIAANDTMMQKVAQLNTLGALDTRPYRQRAEVIPVRGAKVMAFRQPEGNITFPGGGIDPGETPLQAAGREAFEESGVRVKSLRPAGVPSVKKQWNARQLATTNPEHMRRNREYQGSEAHYFVGKVRNPRRLHRGDFDVDAPTPGKLVWMHPHQAIKNLQSKPSVTNDARISVLRRVLQSIKRRALTQFLAKRGSGHELTMQKGAFFSGALTALLKSRLINSGLGFMRQLGVGKNLYSSISRSGIERGWRGTESPLGVAAQSWANFSPTASGTTDFGLGALMGSKLRTAYRGTFAPHVQGSQMPEASSFVNFLRGGNIKNLRNLTDPIAREIANLPKGTPPERVNELAYKLFQAQKGLKQNRAVALSRLPAEMQPLVMGQLQPKSPILRHAQTALTSPVNTQLEQKVRNLQNNKVMGLLLNTPSPSSALTGAGIVSAITAASKPADALAGYVAGSVAGAAPAAGMLELGQRGRHGLMGKSLGLSTLAGYRKSKLPSWMAKLLGILEPSVLEASQAGRDLRRAIPSASVEQRVKQLANMPLREAIHRDLPRFSRLLSHIWPMGKQAALSRRGLFKSLLGSFVRNEPPLMSVPGVSAAVEGINKAAPKLTRRAFTGVMATAAAGAPDVAKYLATPPLTLVKTLTEHPLTPAKVIDHFDNPTARLVHWMKRKFFPGSSAFSLGDSSAGRIKIGSVELPYRDRSELIARLKDKVLAMEYTHGGIGFYGGGIDPGENPTDAATREFFEESGLKAKNVRPAGVPPVTLEWTPEMIAENPKLQARAGQFRGSRTHYFVGDIAGRKRHHEKDLDTTTSTTSKPIWVTPEEAISRIEGYSGVDDTTKALAQQRKDISAARMQILRQLIADARAKQASADFAPGLPDRSRFGDVAKLPKEQALKFVIQEHLAQRSGRHYDVRMGTPDTGLYSWATKKEWPGPGGKIMLFQQPVHRYEYGDFQGRIPRGYGKGIVKTHDKGAVLVTHAADDKIKFIVSHRGTPEYYTLIRRSGPPENPKTERQRHSQGGQWLLVNTTPTDVKKWIGLDPKDMAKLRYKSIPAQDVEKLFTQGNIIQNKVDGASMLYRLLDDHIEATSYRVSKEGRPIVHTQRLFGPGGMKVQIPKEHVGTVLRGEAYGTREGKAIPPQELGGILNASLINSLEKQRANKVQMKSMLFDVAGEQNRPYADRLAKLESITKLLPPEHFHLPESAKTPEEARALWETISSGKHPLTHEGVVAWPPQGVPTKAKLMPESDVWIRNVFPGEGKYKGVGAGGVEYSLSPTGEVVGRIGTGFSDEMRRDMIQNPERYVGRLARIGSQEQFPSGAHRAPAFLALHEDYPTKVAQFVHTKEGMATMRAIWKGLSSAFRSPGLPKFNVAPGPFYAQRLQAATRLPELYRGLQQRGFNVVRQRVKEPESIMGHIQAGRTGLPNDVMGMQVYARGLRDVRQAIRTLRQLGVRNISSKAFMKPTYHGVNVKGMYRGIPMELQLSPGRLANFGQIAQHYLTYKPKEALGFLDKFVANKLLPLFAGSSWIPKSSPQLQKMMPVKAAGLDTGIDAGIKATSLLIDALFLHHSLKKDQKKTKKVNKKASLISEVKRRALAHVD